MADDGNIIIIKKKKKGHGGHHGGAWKVAYADFVTAMMALFIVLWVLGQDDEIKEAVAGYFKDPVGFSISTGLGQPKSESIELDIGTEITLREKQEKQFEEMKGRIMDELQKNPQFSGMLDKIEIKMVDEGLRIEMLESADNIFFGLGSSSLNKNATLILHQIASDLKRLPNKVVVEGHTDSRPFKYGKAKVYDNYDLSAERANAARRALEEGGMGHEQIDEVRGYADKRLRDKEDPYSLVNRRISIILKYLQDE